ncbi:MAG: acyl-CoA reductase-like NAD-dependent aldehyde dehydrogenase [Halieaceae bacterium]|jgi:acyl-CoA reductase-like NAD-dependent aldehyde dehydrogenase
MPSTASITTIADRYGLRLPKVIVPFIDGRKSAPDGDAERFTHICPATEEPLYEVESCTPATVQSAVAAARRAFDSGPWPGLSHADRKLVLRRMVQAIDAHRDELAAIQALEVGLPLEGLKTMHMPRTIENFEFFMEVAGTLGGHSYTQTGRYTSVVTREPAGVIALLSPWNAPLVLSSMKLAAALALGNSCVIKASEYSPWSLLRFVEILHEADIPPGLINLVNGYGAVTGRALVEDSGVDVIGFVGGTETGKSIIRGSAGGIKKVGLELGGKSANIVFSSADLETAIDGSLIAILAGNGEQCLAGSRILLQEAIAEEFTERFVARLQNVKIGDPFEASTELGPLAFARHRDKVLDYAKLAETEGAQILAGGKASADFDRGYFVEPTVALVESNQLRICREEVFGPFATIQTFSTTEEALAIANDSDFGLVSYLWSNDLPTVMQVGRQLKAGTVWVNTSLTRDLRAPFGGYKQSGIGRDGLHASVELMTEEKTMMLPNAPLTLPKLGAGN